MHYASPNIYSKCSLHTLVFVSRTNKFLQQDSAHISLQRVVINEETNKYVRPQKAAGLESEHIEFVG